MTDKATLTDEELDSFFYMSYTPELTFAEMELLFYTLLAAGPLSKAELLKKLHPRPAYYVVTCLHTLCSQGRLEYYPDQGEYDLPEHMIPFPAEW